MTEQSIISDDMTLKRMLQDFYRVPDYQREYVGDKITTTVGSLEGFPEWSAEAVAKRQAFLTKLAVNVWDVHPSGSTASA